jgi:general secretion pathway protein K
MSRQRGAALISVLLVLSLALLLTAGMLRSHRLLLQGSAQQLHQVQLRQLGLAGEAWARSVLQDSASAPSGQVDLSQAWARQEPAFEEEADIRVEIHDLSGRLNLNALTIQGQIDQLTLERWPRLLALLDLPELSLPQVGLIQELSQLRLLPGIDGQTLRRLEPWVAVLPREARLNINTAPRLLLMTLDGMEQASADALINQRPHTPYHSVPAFTNDPLLAGLGIRGHGLGVSSRWFRIRVDVAFADRQMRLVSDIERNPDTGRWTVLQRRFQPLLPSEFH